MYENGVSLNLLLTYKCNYECDHCISNCAPNRQEVMTTEQAKEYIDKTIAVAKVGNVGYTGGEPFLFYDMLIELISYTYDKYGLYGGVVTNCFWAHTELETEKKLEELYKSGLRSLVVSCDSYHLEYGFVENIKHVVHKALDLGISLCINTVVTKDVSISKNEITKLLNLTEEDMEKDITIKEIGLLKLGRTITHIPETSLIESEDERFFNGKCPFVINTPTITPNGSVYSCCCFGDAEQNPQELIGYSGNVNNDSFENIFEGMENNLLFNIFNRQGPYSLLKAIKKQKSDVPVRGKYLSNCDICVELHHNPEIRKALSEILIEMTKDA